LKKAHHIKQIRRMACCICFCCGDWGVEGHGYGGYENDGIYIIMLAVCSYS